MDKLVILNVETQSVKTDNIFAELILDKVQEEGVALYEVYWRSPGSDGRVRYGASNRFEESQLEEAKAKYLEMIEGNPEDVEWMD